jgi:hypothetical protein
MLAGLVTHRGLDVPPADLPPERARHAYGTGPFARFGMPALPAEPDLYLWQVDDVVVYVGQTRVPLRTRLGPQGYSTISNYNTFARQSGRTNGGQKTNCRINNLANDVLKSGKRLAIWYRTHPKDQVRREEARWMETFGVPLWNRRIEQLRP